MTPFNSLSCLEIKGEYKSLYVHLLYIYLHYIYKTFSLKTEGATWTNHTKNVTEEKDRRKNIYTARQMDEHISSCMEYIHASVFDEDCMPSTCRSVVVKQTNVPYLNLFVLKPHTDYNYKLIRDIVNVNERLDKF